MSYIGRKPTVGNFQICDAISVVNGQAAYTMQVGSVNVIPQSASHMICSLNGTIQKPNSSYTVSGSTITFSSNLATGDVIDFIQILGDVLDIGVPSDATVTDAKTNFVSTSSAAGLQIKGDGTTDGTLQLNCSQNSHGIKIKSPPHSAGASYTLTMPNNDGDANQFLQTNGSGVLSFAAATAPGWVKIGDTVTCSTNTASVDFDNLSSDYSMYVVIGTLIRPEITASRLTMNFGTDGSTYAAAKTSIYSEEYVNEGGTDHSGIAINNTYSLDYDTGDQNISSGLSNHGTYGKAGTMIAWLTGLGQGGNYASYMVNVNGFSNDNYAKWSRANGQIQVAADCVRFKFHQHGIAAGNFTLFGVTQ